MYPTSWPAGLANVSPGLYFFATMFETACLIFVLFILILAIRRYSGRKQPSTLALTTMYGGFAFGLVVTISAKLLLYIVANGYQLGNDWEKSAFWGIMIGVISLVVFDMEIFSTYSKKRKIGISTGFIAVAIVPAVYELINFTSDQSIYTYIWYLAISLVAFLIHFKASSRVLKKAIENKLEQAGMRSIFIQAIFGICYFLCVSLSAILDQLSILYPFNFLYFLSWIFLIGFILSSYIGYFLPSWFRKFYST